MTRDDVTALILAAKLKKKLSWAQLAEVVGFSKEWSTAALLGQMTLTEAQAKAVGEALDLPEDAVALLQVVPYKGSLPTAVPTDPLIYRFYELINVYGTTFKELIHEEFGDGIMSAIDFKMDLKREPNDAGDRVSITMSGKFLPYKTYWVPSTEAALAVSALQWGWRARVDCAFSEEAGRQSVQGHRLFKGRGRRHVRNDPV